MNKFLTTTAIALVLTATGAVAAWAQDEQMQNQQMQEPQAQDQEGIEVLSEERVDLGEWNYESLYAGGWRAEEFLDTPVYGAAGDELGEVENIIVGADGRIQSIIVESGGFLDIGDTHLRVPWEEVEVSAELDRVVIPVNEENVGEYGLFAGGVSQVTEDFEAPQRRWKITELLDDYARLGEDRQTYGWVEDAIFSSEGNLEAVVVAPDIGYGAGGPYAYPYYGYGYGWTPGYAYYDLPYTVDDVAEIEPFDYGRLGPAGTVE